MFCKWQLVSTTLASVPNTTYEHVVLFLASNSPQRAMLLRQAGLSFTVVRSTCDEETIQAALPEALAIERARGKARGGVLPETARTNGVVLGADTVVALGETVFGKPSDRADARRILAALAGTTHAVYTGHCCRCPSTGAEHTRATVTWVTMRSMSAEQIAAYVDSGESDGRAGAYAIQEHGDQFVSQLDGAWDTVVGLHVPAVIDLYHACLGTWPPGYQPH